MAASFNVSSDVEHFTYSVFTYSLCFVPDEEDFRVEMVYYCNLLCDVKCLASPLTSCGMMWFRVISAVLLRYAVTVLGFQRVPQVYHMQQTVVADEDPLAQTS